MALEDLLSIYLIYNEDSLCAVNPISCDPNLSEDDWLKPISKVFLEETVLPYIIRGHNEVFEKRLEELLASNSRCLESILQIDNIDIQSYIIDAFATKSSLDLEEESVEKIEGYLNTKYNKTQCSSNLCTTSTKVLTDYLTHFSTNTTHADFLLDLLNKEDFDKSARSRAIHQFINDVNGHKPVDNRVFDKYTSLLDYDDINHSLLKAFGNACVNYDYVPAISILAEFEKLLDNKGVAEEVEYIISTSITKTLEKSLNGRKVLEEKEYEEIARYITLLFNKRGELSLNLLEVLFESYKEDQKHFETQIIDIVAEYKQLHPEILENLVAILPKLEEWNGIFIGLRVAQHQINIPTEVIKYFIKFINSEVSEIRKTAIDLFYEIGIKIPEEIRSEVIDELIKSEGLVEEFKKTKGLIPGKIGKLLEEFGDKVTEEQHERYAIQKEVGKWEVSGDIVEKVSIGRELASKISNNTAEILIPFVKKNLYSQEIDLLKVAIDLSREISKFRLIEWSEEEKKLLLLLDEANKGEVEILNNGIKRIEFGNLFLILREQWIALEKNIKSFKWDINKYLEKISFRKFTEITEFLGFIESYEIRENELSKIIENSIYIDNLYQEILEGLIVKISEGVEVEEKEVIKRNVKNIIKTVGWEAKQLFKFIHDVYVADDIGNAYRGKTLIALLDKLSEYSISLDKVDRYGFNALKITEDWIVKLNRIDNDNRFYIIKDNEILINEIGRNLQNLKNPRIQELIRSGYFLDKLEEISKIEKYWPIHIADSRLDKLEEKVLYLYRQDQKICFAIKSIEESKIQEKCIKEQEGTELDNNKEGTELDKILNNKVIGSKERKIIYKKIKDLELGWSVKQISDWGEEEILNWKAGITTVDESNLAEVIAVLKQAVYITTFKSKYHVRDAQVISVLTLFAGDGGRLLQVSTGEGKSVIIGMFAATKALMNQFVDIITSSKVLAVRDAKEQEEFYKILGISSGHNIIDGNGKKECYKNTVLYGDTLHFIGDDLKDITSYVKYGRGYGVLIMDEVDNMFMDNTNMKVQLSSGIPGFHYLKGLKIYSWIRFKVILDMVEERGNKFYLKEREEYIGNKEEFEKYKLYKINEYIEQNIHEEKGQYYLIRENTTELIGGEEELKERLEEYIFNYQQERIKYDAENDIYLYKNPEEEIGGEKEFAERMKDIISSYIKDSLLQLDNNSEGRLVTTPRHLNSFMREHSGQLADSIITASWYEEGVNYKISDHEFKKIISPVDYQNTGVIQLSLIWSNGLHQYLELKHSLYIKTESLTNVFRSYVGYFLKYEGNIYGLTGTLGAEAHHEYLSKVYKLDTVVMPNYIRKNLVEFDSIIRDNQKDWVMEISSQAIRKADAAGRAVLIICKTINEVDRVYNKIKDRGYQGKVIKYSDNADEEAISKKLRAGDIIVATNLAGRGTDLEIDKEVNRNGGLHVILSYFPESVRVQDQAFGRGARNGDSGSAQMIIYKEVGLSIEDLNIARDLEEKEKLKASEEDNIEQMKLQDGLFDKFISLIATVNSPTGYNISRGNPDVKSNGTIYVYNKTAEDNQQQIYLSCYKPGDDKYATPLESKEISKYVEHIDSRAYHHLLDVLSKDERAFSQRDYETIHFFAAEMGCIKKEEKVLERVHKKYNKKFGNHYIGLGSQETNQTKLEEIIKNRYNESFVIWEEDRGLYNREYEISQLKENWAIWLKNAGTFGPGGLFGWANDTKREVIEELNRNFTVFAEEQLRLFENDVEYTNAGNSGLGINPFFAKINNQCSLSDQDVEESDKLMQNPNYLVQKSRHYIGLHYHDDNEELRNKGSCSNCIGITFNKAPKGPIGDAIKFGERAVELDIELAWNAYNILAITKLIGNGEGITDYEDAEKAQRVIGEFRQDVVNTINSIKGYIIPKQTHECTTLIVSKVVKNFSDTIKQCLFILKAYEKISEQLENLAQKEVKADQMIRISKLFGAEKILGTINGKDLQNKFEILVEVQDLNATIADGKNLTAEEIELNSQKKTQILATYGISGYIADNVFNGTSVAEFKALTLDFSHDLNNIGYLGFDIEVYELEKDWTDTFIAAILSIATIYLGIVLGPMGGFLGVLGKGLAIQGILEMIQIGVSVYNDIPVNLDDFIKSKAIGFAVAIITAGIAKGLDSIKVLHNGKMVGWSTKYVAGFKALEKGAFILEVVKGAAIAEAINVASNYIAKNYIESNSGNIKEDIREAATEILIRYGNEISQLIAEDKFNEELYKNSAHEKINQVINDAVNIINRYASQGTARQILGGAAQKAASYINPAVGLFGSVANIVVGYVKSEKAMDELKSELGRRIEREAQSAMGTKEMMYKRVKQSYPEDFKKIIEDIEADSNLLLSSDSKDIDYYNCNKFESIEKKRGVGVVSECNNIHNIVRQATSSELREIFKENLLDAVFRPVTDMYRKEVTTPIVSTTIEQTISIIKKIIEDKKEEDKKKEQQEKIKKEKEEAKRQEEEERRKREKEFAEGIRRQNEKARTTEATVDLEGFPQKPNKNPPSGNNGPGGNNPIGNPEGNKESYDPFGKYGIGEEGGFRVYVTKEGKVVYEDAGIGQCGVLGDKLNEGYANEAEVKNNKNYKDFESFKRNIISEGHLKNYEMSRMYGNGDPMGMGGDIRYDINKDPAMDSYLGSKYEIYQDTGRIDVGRWSLEMDNMGEIMKDIDKADPLYVTTIIKGGKKGLLVAYKYGEKIVNGFVVHAALGEAEVEAAMSGRIIDREKMKVELENVRIVGPVVEAITPDIVKKFIREKIEDMTPSEKLAYGIVGDAIVIIPIIKGATGVIKQAGEWVVVGKDIAGGAKKLFTKPDTPHHKAHTDTAGHKVDGDSHLGGSANKINDEILTFVDKNTARTSLEGTIFFKEGNKFFKRASTSKTQIYEIKELKNGNLEMSFFTPANTKGYGKKYIMELDKGGNKISDYKQTIDPKGNILNTKLTGE